MNRDELEAKAKELGLKVKGSFMDDFAENAIILAIGIILGYVLKKMFF